MGSFVTHLEAAINGAIIPARTLQTVHENRPLWVRYDLNAVGNALSPDDLHSRPQTMWRYRELLPVEDEFNIVSLGETVTPLIECPALSRYFGMRQLLIKDESRLPTGSFKSRGMAMAVSMAKELGIKRVAAPTAGNAGGALAAYAARAGMECFIFMPEDTPVVNQREAALFGAKCFLVNGLISDCGRIVREGKDAMGWFDMSTLREPYRIEGKKTMGLELAEQMDWKLPDVILYPTGGGTGLIGMWKAFAELTHLGWLDHPRKPRMFVCQSEGCAPIVNAYNAGERFAKPIENAHTIASGLRVPGAVGDFMILDAVRESGGRAVAAAEKRLTEWMRLGSSKEGLSICPETAACFDVLEQSLAQGWITRDESVVIFNTGAAQKYVEAMNADLPRIDHTRPVDWSTIG
jgi:threonine synthase